MGKIDDKAVSSDKIEHGHATVKVFVRFYLQYLPPEKEPERKKEYPGKYRIIVRRVKINARKREKRKQPGLIHLFGQIKKRLVE